MSKKLCTQIFVLLVAVSSVAVVSGPLWGTEGENRVQVAGVVLKWLPTEKAANYRRAEALIRQAACEGADIVCTTEGFLEGYAIEDKSLTADELRALGEEIPGGEYYQRLRELAKELGIVLVAGMLERDREQLYNTAIILGADGQLIGKYHKQNFMRELVHITAGEQSSVFETPFGRVGVMICADRQDRGVVRRFCENGADFLICPSGGMFGAERNDPIVQARSKENGRHIVFVHPAEFLVTGPKGDVLAQTIVGDRRAVTRDEVGRERDASGVFHFQLPMSPRYKTALKKNKPAELKSECKLTEFLKEPLIDVALPWQQLKAYVGKRIPVPEAPKTVAEWEQRAQQLQRDMLEKIVFRGEAQQWRKTPLQVEWFDTIETGDGYRIKKFSYEALPGMWAPALLYEPTELAEKAPVFINVNGHHRGGKAMPYKQRRCINLAKRGILAYNLEFLDMGQLYHTGRDNKHNRMLQIDLCGTSGLAPFWLVMERGLDVAMKHEHADASRVGVAGLSGGGWQTIWLASLDNRITLANPVAGYGSNFVRLDYRNNIGDAEQIPSDMCLVGDYAHMTALLAPRPLLLTNNAEDNCCFKPNEIYPRLKQVAEPIYRLYDRAENFSTHINYDPGTHNFDRDNREALHRLVGQHFFAGDLSFDPQDLPVAEKDIRSEEELSVPLPAENATLHSLAVELSRSLPEQAGLPKEKAPFQAWQKTARKRLKELVRYETYEATAEVVKETEVEGVTAEQVVFKLDEHWTLPAAVIAPQKYASTVVLVGDEGRAALAAKAKKYVAEGKCVVVADLTGFGEAKGDFREVEPLLIAMVGRRPLGVYAGQLAALARWARGDDTKHTVRVEAVGPRNGMVALIAAAVETDLIVGLGLQNPWGSLKRLIEENMTAEDAPEQFCFGLLKEFDVPQILALVAPRPVVVEDPDGELGALK